MNKTIIKNNRNLDIPKWFNIFIEIKFNKETTATYLSKKCDVTYSWIKVILKIFLEKGFITLHKSGRTVTIKLTKKGEIVADLLIRLYPKVKNVN